MRSSRSILFTLSVTLVVLLLGGGLAVKVGAAEASYDEVVTFSEVLSLVLDNYVDPVDAGDLLEGAYEGMLAGLDPNGAYLAPDEVAEWKTGREGEAGPGVCLLKGGRALQIVAVDEASPAAEAGLEVGDHIRTVDGRLVRDLSLTQSWRLVQGPAGTRVTLEIVHPADGFSRETVTLERVKREVAPYRIDVQRGGIAVLRIFDTQRLSTEALAGELDDVRSRGISSLLLDLRNLADLRPRAAASVAGLFAGPAELRLRDRAGRLVETLEAPAAASAWKGQIAALVNGATAGSGEALALLLQQSNVRVLGESTYGLGAEVKLFELDNGAGLLVSSAEWETASGSRWNTEGVKPDQELPGHGDDYAAASADQLERALDVLEQAAGGGEPAGPGAA